MERAQDYRSLYEAVNDLLHIERLQHKDAQRALDTAQARVKQLEDDKAYAIKLVRDACINAEIPVALEGEISLSKVKDLVRKVNDLQAQLVRWKEALGEWLWNCTNLLGDYHIKTVQDFNEEVNRRIAWLMQHLDYTLPPPMTDEERDRMRKLSEDNATLQAQLADRDAMILQMGKQAARLAKDGIAAKAQLRQVEGSGMTRYMLQMSRRPRRTDRGGA